MRVMLFIFVVCPALAWCGMAGGVTSAHSRLAQPVRDLRAIRKGDKVTLTWSQPREITEGQPTPGALGVTKVCRSILAAPPDSSRPFNSVTACGESVGELRPRAAAAKPAGASNDKVTLQFIDTLSEKIQRASPLQFAIYRVEVQDEHGRSTGFSNPAAVTLAPTVSPEGLHFQLDVRGVYLIWTQSSENQAPSLQFDYRVYRREKGSAKAVAVSYLRAVMHQRGENRWSAVDRDIEWEKSYSYWLVPVTTVYSGTHQLLAEVEGDDSQPVEVVAHDVFPPAPPEGLLAVASEIPNERFVDLIWAPNIEKDVAGYNVYRREEAGPETDAKNGTPERINSAPITMLSFHDTGVDAGHKYFYSISAVDLRGNESAKSQESAEVKP
ncbi:MAG TPA: hypothetical protein VFA71_10805 [Terriglobales bacterium]|nr:hypothetical protein [Terriglobales bacterium]